MQPQTPRRPDQNSATIPATGGRGAGFPSSGTVRARLVIIQGVAGSGVFIYDPSGNLVGSWVGIAGTDPVDHLAVPSGLESRSSDGTLTGVLNSASLTLQKLSGALAPPQVQIGDQSLAATTPQVTTVKPTEIDTPQVKAIQPGTASTVEVWHPMTPLQNSWSNTGGSDVTAQYRLLPDNHVELTGLLTHASTSGTSQVFTMPTGYIPAHTQNFQLSFLAATNVYASSASTARVFVDTSGNVTFNALPAGTTQASVFCRYSLDA